MTDQDQPNKPYTLAILVFSLINAFLFSYLLFEKTLGIATSAFIISFVALFEITKLFYHKKLLINKFHTLLPIIIFNSLILFFRADSLVLFLNLLSLLALLPIYFYGTINPTFLIKFSEVELFEFILQATISPRDYLHNVFKCLEFNTDKLKVVLKAALVALLMTPIFLCVLTLLSFADEAFSSFITSIFDIFSLHTVFKVFISVFFSYISFSYLNGFLKRSNNKTTLSESQISKYISTDITIPFVATAMLNLIYITYTIFQFGYIFGGEAFAHANRVTFSNYATSGFWEMIAVNLINCVILYLLQTRFSIEGKRRKVLLGTSYLIIIFANIIMILSSHMRLSVYEEGYGYTVQRLLPHIFLIYLFLQNILFAANNFLKDSIRQKILIIGSFWVLTVFLVGYSMFNMEAFIVRNNINKFLPTSQKLDKNYLIYKTTTEGKIELQKQITNPSVQSMFDVTEIQRIENPEPIFCTDRNPSWDNYQCNQLLRNNH